MQFVVSEKISSIFYTICCYQLLNLLLWQNAETTTGFTLDYLYCLCWGFVTFLINRHVEILSISLLVDLLKWEYVTLSRLQMELCQQGKSVLLLESYLVLNFQRNIKDTAGSIWALTSQCLWFGLLTKKLKTSQNINTGDHMVASTLDFFLHFTNTFLYMFVVVWIYH